MTLKIEGVPELKAGLGRIADGLPDLQDAPQAAAAVVAARAKALAPKRTGRLARSIRGDVSAGRADVGTPVEYGIPVHFGTRWQRARPFLFQALQAEQKDILDAWTKDVQALIDKAV